MNTEDTNLLKEKREAVAEELNKIPEPEERYEQLALHVYRVFDNNAQFRRTSGVDDRLMECLRMSRGEYSERERALIAAKGAPMLYLPIADMKKRAAVSMMSEIFNNTNDKPWTLEATPVPDIREDVSEEAILQTKEDFIEYAMATGVEPDDDTIKQYTEDRWEEIMEREKQYAKKKASILERLVEDKMVEGGWRDAFKDFVLYLCTYGTAVIKSPVPRMQKKKKIVKGSDGTRRFKMTDKVVLTYEAVSPFDCYPEPGAKKVGQGNFCIKSRYTPKDLWLFSKQKGNEWKTENINYILSHHPSGGVEVDKQEDDQREEYQEAGGSGIDETCMLEGIEYYGDARGSWLVELGFTEDTAGREIEIDDYYEVVAICVDNRVVYCKIVEPEIGRPLSKGTFYPVTDSWWGEGVFLKCACTQKMANAAVRDLIVNMAQSSGPQMVIKSLNRLHPSCSLASEPWKTWFFNDSPLGQNDNPMSVFQVNSNARELSYIIDFCMKQADNDTGIPSYTYGSTIAGGAGRTSSGLAMLMESVNRGVKSIIASIDSDVIRDSVKRTADWIMMNEATDVIIGDCEVNPSGIASIVFKETESNRRKEFLNMSANPAVAQVLLPTGIAVLVRKEAESLGVNPDLVVPSQERLEELDEIAQAKAKMQMMTQQVQMGQEAGMVPQGGGKGQLPPEAMGMAMGGGGGGGGMQELPSAELQDMNGEAM